MLLPYILIALAAIPMWKREGDHVTALLFMAACLAADMIIRKAVFKK